MGQDEPSDGRRRYRRRASDRDPRGEGTSAPSLEAGPGEAAQSLALQKIELEMQNEELQLQKLELQVQNEELQDFHEELDESWKQIDQLVSERTVELLRTVKRLSTEVRVHNLAESALRATCSELQCTHLRLQAENAYLHQASARFCNFGILTGDSQALARLREDIEDAAVRETPVLVVGEPGVGKEVVVRAIHNRSARKHRPLVTADCTLRPVQLLESQLFGRDAGPSPDVFSQWVGRLELADQGTLFLDEAAALPQDLRERLLGVLATGQFSPLGSARVVRLGARIIAATSRIPDEARRAGQFPPDRYKRLGVQVLTVPPLRERREDIPSLVESFVAWFNRKHGRQVEAIPAEALADLQARPWPCNVRELREVVERAVLNSPGRDLVLG